MVKIGLEIHLQLSYSKKKLFCDCLLHDTTPNTNVCEVCTGHPGSLPRVNKLSLRLGKTAASLLNCKLAEIIYFDRKHYVYHDLPKGYQITQEYNPVGTDGYINIPERIRISHVRIEEDPAGSGDVLDFNRSGYPLIEVVTAPDITNSEQAVATVNKIINELHHARIINKYHKTVFRVDANISLGLDKEKTEIKNIGSISDLKQVIDIEIQRQMREGVTMSHTRGYNLALGETTYSRYKETKDEYYFLPEVNIPPIKITKFYHRSLDEDMKLEGSLDQIRGWLSEEGGYEFIKYVPSVIKKYDILIKELRYRQIDLINKNWYNLKKIFGLDLNLFERALRNFLDETPNVSINKIDLESCFKECMKDENFVLGLQKAHSKTLNYLIGCMIKNSHEDAKIIKEFLLEKLKKEEIFE